MLAKLEESAHPLGGQAKEYSLFLQKSHKVFSKTKKRPIVATKTRWGGYQGASTLGLSRWTLINGFCHVERSEAKSRHLGR